LGHIPNSFFLLLCFASRKECCACQKRLRKWTSYLASWAAGITGMYHYAWLIFDRLVLTFCLSWLLLSLSSKQLGLQTCTTTSRLTLKVPNS
jgi:hypothetical protein